jgi:hypothetical protein
MSNRRKAGDALTRLLWKDRDRGAGLRLAFSDLGSSIDDDRYSHQSDGTGGRTRLQGLEV